METRHEWSGRTAATVGRQVAHYRTLRQVIRTDSGLELSEPVTLQELSNRCAALGYPIARSVISKLEKGHRQTVTVDEVQVLAHALGVPPVLLLFPLGREKTAEPLPGLQVDPWAAVQWFSGHSEDPANEWAWPQMGTQSPVMLWGEHDSYNSQVASYQEYTQSHPGGEDPEAERLSAQRMEIVVRSLRRIREIMRDLGLTPPPLSPAAARALGEEESAHG